MNKVRKTQKRFAGILIAASISATFSLLPAYAAYSGAILSEVEINPYHGDSYQISVKTDKNIPIEKYVNSNNEIVLNLKNVKPAKFVNTVYNNATKVDHVIIQPTSNNQVKITLHGTNISASKITLNTKGSSFIGEENLNLTEENKQPNNKITKEETTNLSQATQETKKEPIEGIGNPIPELQQQEKETIIVRQPINNFKPTNSYTDIENTEEDSSLETMQGAMTGNLKNIFNTNNFDWLLRFGVLALLIVGSIKLFKPKEKNVKINLTQDIREREIDLLKSISNKRDLIGIGLKDNSKITGLPKRSTYNSISNYGLREYQNSQIPPSNLRNNSSMTRIKKEIKNNKPLPSEALLKSLNSQNSTIKTSQKNININKITNKEIGNKVNIDSKKFLETMANLYERSGRTDLAHGIKRNIINSK